MKNSYWTALFGAWSVAVTTANAAQVLVNGDFETGNFSGWTVGINPDYASGGRPAHIDPNGDGWIVSNHAQFSRYGPPIAPISGYSAYNGFDGSVVNSQFRPIPNADLNFFLRQSFTKSSSYLSANVQFTYDIEGGPNFPVGYVNPILGPIEPHHFFVNILDSSLLNVATLYSQSVPTSQSHPPSEVPLQTINIPLDGLLNSLPNGTYWLNFQELLPQWDTGQGLFVLDNVSLDLVVPRPPTSGVPDGSEGAWALSLLGLGVLTRFRKHIEVLQTTEV